MTELFIANATKQNFLFLYRALERPGVVQQPVPIGGQTRISPTGDPNLTPEEIDYIIKQNQKYGIVAIDEVEGLKTPFSGFCFSIGKPVSADKLRRAMLKHEEALEKMGKKIRQEAAIAVQDHIEKSIGTPIRTLDMSVQEVEPRGGFSDELTHISEGVRVSRENESSEGFPMVIPGGKRR